MMNFYQLKINKKSFNLRVVLCRIRLFPTLISKIIWLWSELPLNLINEKFRIEEPNPFPENPQIPTSLDRLGLLREAGTELVSNVYVAAQAREFERRKEAQEKKQGRIQKLQVEIIPLQH